MKTLICYATKQGTTLRCSKLIASKTKNYDLVDIKQSKDIDFNQYDRIYLGTPVYYGKINRHMAKLMKKQKKILLEKDLRIFTLGMDDKDMNKTRKSNFDKNILDHAIIKYLGGAYDFEKMNWFERFLVNKISTFSESIQDIKADKLEELMNEDKVVIEIEEKKNPSSDLN